MNGGLEDSYQKPGAGDLVDAAAAPAIATSLPHDSGVPISGRRRRLVGRAQRREPIKAALALLPSNILAWAWWGVHGVEVNGLDFLPVSIVFIVMWFWMCAGTWHMLTRPLP